MDVVSGSPLTWNNWAKNQPASLSEDQDCAVINKDNVRNTEISSQTSEIILQPTSYSI